ncbi:hypothetical protein PR202_ga28841 [Eleusine coracana subsp. coracana]|uniref:Uncharacterized protein n=1 Tax=Eleusine coracana subsp. coracana TaxID=191504 RepID=A0AAV5DID4_ELECO|nr:hypothetical protein PR202_ga28841 [Eleusine coracana subsp. coracana]
MRGLSKGKAMYLLFVKAEALTASGIPVRSVLTSYYKSAHFLHRRHDLYNSYTSPEEVILCPHSRQSMYCQLLCGLVEHQEVLRLGAVFASAFLRFVSFLEQNWCDLVSDIRIGQFSSSITNSACRLAMQSFLALPNPELTYELEMICSSRSWKGILGRLWPNVKYIEAVLTGTMAQYIPMLEFYSGGGVPSVCTMYASSESYFGVNLRLLCSPTDVSYTILPNMAYFEFIPLENGLKLAYNNDMVQNDKLVGLVDVKVGCFYELVVTTFSGPLTKGPCAPLNPQLLESCCISVEESLDSVYRRCRTHDKSVGPLEIRLVQDGAFDALMDLLVSQDSSINQYKTPRCIESGLALKLLNSKVIACFFSPRDPEWTMPFE